MRGYFEVVVKVKEPKSRRGTREVKAIYASGKDEVQSPPLTAAR